MRKLGFVLLLVALVLSCCKDELELDPLIEWARPLIGEWDLGAYTITFRSCDAMYMLYDGSMTPGYWASVEWKIGNESGYIHGNRDTLYSPFYRLDVGTISLNGDTLTVVLKAPSKIVGTFTGKKK